MARTDYQSVEDCIAAQPEPARPVLERVRATIRKALPRATARAKRAPSKEAKPRAREKLSKRRARRTS
jgi:hypothetical protein